MNQVLTWMISLALISSGSSPFASAQLTPSDQIKIDLPDGFSIQHVAGNDLVPDAYCVAVSSQGEVVVSGGGYLRRMVDADGDGVFESTETLFEGKIAGAQGLCFDGDTLLCVSNGGVQRLTFTDDESDEKMETLFSITTDAEHAAHAIRKSDDGWFYLIAGNKTRIRPEYYTITPSPIDYPRAGFLMRFRGDGAGEKQIIAHGFRNAYDFDIDSQGRLFVFDSDGERDVSLPWYQPTRVFQIRIGDDAGWVSPAWKRPSYFPDMPMTIASLGRGSPTGVRVCRGNAFGENYRDAVLVGDWTFGRITVLVHGGAASEWKQQPFATPQGSFGFAVTDFEFDVDGSLLVTVGGRGLAGGLYRIARNGDASGEVNIKQLLATPALDPSPTTALARPDREELAAMTDEERMQKISDQLQSRGPRAAQLMLGDSRSDGMFTSYTAASPIANLGPDPPIAKQLLDRFDDGDLHDRIETARLAAMLRIDSAALRNRIVEQSLGDGDPVRQIHWLNCIALTKGPLNEIHRDVVGSRLTSVETAISFDGLAMDRNWQPRMQELSRKLFDVPGLVAAVERSPSFGNPDSVWVFTAEPDLFSPEAPKKFAKFAESYPEEVSPALLRIVAKDPNNKPLLRTFLGRAELESTIIAGLSREPEAVDIAVFANGLASRSLTTVKAAAIALRRIGVADRDSQQSVLAAAIAAAKRPGFDGPHVSVRDQLVMLMQSTTGQSFGYAMKQFDASDEQQLKQWAALDSWAGYLNTDFDIELPVVAGADEWKRRLSQIDFSGGESLRGEQAFTTLQCARCHDGDTGNRLGPSLAGITRRFSKLDLLESILDPDAVVPDRYRATLVMTLDGEIISGSVVYDSVDGLTMIESSGRTVRINAADIDDRKLTDQSIMPAGLFDGVTDQQFADLWTYLETLNQ